MLQQSDSGTTDVVPPPTPEEEPAVPVDIDVQVAWSPEGLKVSAEPVCVAGCVGSIRWTLDGAPSGASLEIAFSAETIAVFESLSAHAGEAPRIEARLKEAHGACLGSYRVVVRCPSLAVADEYSEPSPYGGTGEPTDSCGTDGTIDVSGYPPPR